MTDAIREAAYAAWQAFQCRKGNVGDHETWIVVVNATITALTDAGYEIRTMEDTPPQCSAVTRERWYSGPHRCPFKGTRAHGGKWYCVKHFKMLAAAEEQSDD